MMVGRLIGHPNRIAAHLSPDEAGRWSSGYCRGRPATRLPSPSVRGVIAAALLASQAQRKAIRAPPPPAKNRLGIPRKVGREYSKADKGGKLPGKVKSKRKR